MSRGELTLLQLPLGFFATFFGMNNAQITGDTWMPLDEQVMYMCKLGAHSRYGLL